MQHHTICGDENVFAMANRADPDQTAPLGAV